MSLRGYAPSAAQELLMNDLKAALAKHPNLSAVEMLAIASVLVGNLIAFQDQTKITPELARELVASNIEAGNQTAIETLLGRAHGNA